MDQRFPSGSLGTRHLPELRNQPFMFQRNTQNHEIMMGGACHMGQMLLGGHGGPPQCAWKQA